MKKYFILVFLPLFLLTGCKENEETITEATILIGLEDTSGVGLNGWAYVFPDNTEEYDPKTFNSNYAGTIATVKGDTICSLTLVEIVKNRYSEVICPAGRYYVVAEYMGYKDGSIFPVFAWKGQYVETEEGKFSVAEFKINRSKRGCQN